MRSSKMRLLFRVLPVIIALCMVVGSTQKAFAWTHEQNNYPNDPTCGGSSSSPCLYWPEPNHVSTTIYASFDGIGSVGPTNYNFIPTMSDTFADFNSIQNAFNPFMYNCNYTGCQSAVHYVSADIGAVYWANTDVTPSNYGPVQYANGQYYAIFSYTTVTFNTEVSWNNNLQYGSYPFQADGRKVARHETGHVQGLGHTGYAAIMQMGEEYFNPMVLQANDIEGIQAIYTGYIPS